LDEPSAAYKAGRHRPMKAWRKVTRGKGESDTRHTHRVNFRAESTRAPAGNLQGVESTVCAGRFSNSARRMPGHRSVVERPGALHHTRAHRLPKRAEHQCSSVQNTDLNSSDDPLIPERLFQLRRRR
jgi:hypothetical protein